MKNDIKNHQKLSIHRVLPVAENWQQRIQALPEAAKVDITGGLRRGLHAVDKAELVVAAESFDDFLTSFLRIIENSSVKKGSDHCLEVTLDDGFDLVIQVVHPKEYGNMLFYTTGSEAHIKQIMHALNGNNVQIKPDGIRIDDQVQWFGNEVDLYKAFQMPFIPPELREGKGEINLAIHQSLPDLINQEDLKSDLHIHTQWTDGKASIKEIILKATQQHLSVIAITDHSPFLLKPRYYDASYLLEQQRQIDSLNKTFDNEIVVLKGVEVDILPDGSLDLPDWMLKKMDVVIASLHMALDLPKDVMTDRLIKAIQNPHVDIIGHPGGRSLPSDDCTNLEWDRVFEAAAKNNVALEINSHKHHPFFDEEKIITAVQHGAILALNSDTHRLPMMEDSRYGIFLARRAGVSASNVINTWEPEHLLLWLKGHRNGATNN